jgi:hypothetical protein
VQELQALLDLKALLVTLELERQMELPELLILEMQEMLDLLAQQEMLQL